MNNLYKSRKEKGLSRKELSIKSGIPENTILELELSLRDMKKEDKEILNKLAIPLNTTIDFLLKDYYYIYVGTDYRIAQLQYVIVSHEDWLKLEWKATDIYILNKYNGKFINTYSDAAEVLGYKMFAGVVNEKSFYGYYYENLTECYIKDNKLYMFSKKTDNRIYMAELSYTPRDVIER